MKTQATLIELAKEKGIEIKFLQDIKPGYEVSTFYGGTLVELKHIQSGSNYYVGAYGEVRADYYVADTDKPEETFVDKHHDGSFYCDAKDFVENDESLFELMNNEGTEVFPQIVFHDNNWFELNSFEDVEDKYEIDGFVLTEDYFSTALEEAINEIVNIFKEN